MRRRINLHPVPADTLLPLTGLVALGGDALEDSEALYDLDDQEDDATLSIPLRRGELMTVLTREELHRWIDALPEAKLAKLTAGLSALREAFGEPSSSTTPYTPVKLGGLWAGIKIDEQQIAQVRREMWANFGEDLP